jgi:hypothetical protein
MATTRQYAYYLEGNQIAVVEKDVSFDNDVDSKDYGPGASKQRWESPQETIADGLKVKYVYTPNYRINDASDTQAITGYEEEGTGLLKVIGGSLSTSASITHIVIEGLGKFNGLHKVKTLTADGYTLETKYNGPDVTNAGTMSIDVSVLEDESFELDLPNYLQKALVYYVKAKIAEDGGDIKLKEYSMREFRKMIEKYESSRVTGLRLTVPGSHAIR